MGRHYIVTHRRPWYVRFFLPGRAYGDDKGLFTMQVSSYMDRRTKTPQTGQTASVHINTHHLYGISSPEGHDGRVVGRVRGHGQNQYDDASNTRRLRCDTLSPTLGICPHSQRTRKLWQVYVIAAVACPSRFSRPLFVYHDCKLDKQLRVHTRRWQNQIWNL